ncbi:MAG: autotransporter domain-containing protein, partial [Sedimentisphaerales bacterium]
FAGPITLASASTIGSTANTLTASGTIDNGGFLLTVGGAGNETLSGIISGTGALTKAGAGTVTLSGTNAYSGGTTVTAGTLTGTTSAQLSPPVPSPAPPAVCRVPSLITRPWSLTRVPLAPMPARWAERTTVTAGTLTGTTSSLQGAITNNSAVVFDQGTAGTYAGAMSGTGTLTKTGASILTLSGNNTYTGLTTLSVGGLILNGRVGGDLTVNGGTLSGDGTIGGTLTLAGSTCSPGSSIGTMTILGDYVQNTGSILNVEVEKTSSGALRSDLLDVGGSATLAAGSIISVADISPGSRIIGTGDTFTIIKTGGGVTDNGALITDTSAVLNFAGLVSGNNYRLVATREAFAANVNGGNKSSVLGAIDSDLGSASGDYVTVINALTALDSAQLNDAARQLDPLPYASTTSFSLKTAQQMTGNLANYLSARRSGIEELMMLNARSREGQLLIADASDDPRMLAYVINEDKRIAKMQQDEADSKIKGFIRPFGMFYEQDTTPKLTGFRAQAVGTQFGFDKSHGPNLIMGIGGGYSHSFINFKESRGEGDTDSFRAGPYASYFKNNFFVDTSVSFGYHENENKRSLKFGTINRTARSDYHAYDLSAYIGGGYDFHINKWTVTPSASAQYIHYRSENFKETGAGAAGLDVDAATAQSLRSKLGVTVSTVTELYGTKIVPELFAGWAHEFTNYEDIKARFVQGTAKFTTDVDYDRDDSVYFGAGISALLKKNVSAFVRYEGEYSSGSKINALNVGITILF